MKILLNRDVKNLGKVGDVVSVKNGYGRNFLIPRGYAIVATKVNIAKLQDRLEELKKQNEVLIKNAKTVAEILEKEIFNVVRQAADDDTIYGSVRTRDVYNFICDLLKKNKIDFNLNIGAVKILEPIRALGKYVVNVEVFSGVESSIRLNVCRAIADFESDVVEFDKKMEQKMLSSKDAKENIDKVVAKEVAKIEKTEANDKKEENKKAETKEDKENSGENE